MSTEHVYLIRYVQNPNYTKGVLRYNGVTLCTTLELPYLENQRNISCIPEGEYVVRTREGSPKFPYEHYILADVPQRDWILIHRGNTIKDTSGCILVGEDTGQHDFVANSRLTLGYLRGKLPETFTLHVLSFKI